MTSLAYERQLQHLGYRHILGMDEAGRGAWAGPVCVAAVCLPPGRPALRAALREVRDSKAMSPRRREGVAPRIREQALTWGLGEASRQEIDALGIDAATRQAMQRALLDACQRRSGFEPDCLFLDALIWPEMLPRYPQVTLIKGDARSLTVAAASVLAKTWRDERMRALDEEFPGYGFRQHKGYGTAGHRRALERLGPAPAHRRSYQPLRAFTGERRP